MSWPLLLQADTIAVYAALPHEADLQPLLRFLWQTGRQVLFPRCKGERMDFCLVGDAAELTQGAFGIAEPKAGCPALPAEEIALFLIPLEATDPAGHRLGKGKGYYDRTLADSKGIKAGVSLKHQELPAVPADPWDLTLDYLIDKDGIHAVCSGGIPWLKRNP